MGITQIILRLRSQAGFSPREINWGGCEDFADAVVREMRGKGAVAVWGNEVPPEMWSEKVRSLSDWFSHVAIFHCFVKFKCRFYDSECPLGCDFPDELPFFQKKILNVYFPE